MIYKQPQKYINNPIQRCRYYVTMCEPYLCLPFEKDCKKCGSSNHFEGMCRSNRKPELKESDTERLRAVCDTCHSCDEAQRLAKEFNVVRSNVLISIV